jgi:pyruvate dehydrogenase E1 component alpha subunit
MGIPSWTGDGRDVASVDVAIRQGFAHVREHRSPAVVVIEVYRFRGHYEGDADLYRDRAEKDRAMSPEHDPLARCRADLLRSGHTEADLLAVQDKANETVSAWFSAAREIPLPDPRQAHEGVYADV